MSAKKPANINKEGFIEAVKSSNFLEGKALAAQIEEAAELLTDDEFFDVKPIKELMKTLHGERRWSWGLRSERKIKIFNEVVDYKLKDDEWRESLLPQIEKKRDEIAKEGRTAGENSEGSGDKKASKKDERRYQFTGINYKGTTINGGVTLDGCVVLSIGNRGEYTSDKMSEEQVEKLCEQGFFKKMIAKIAEATKDELSDSDFSRAIIKTINQAAEAQNKTYEAFGQSIESYLDDIKDGIVDIKNDINDIKSKVGKIEKETKEAHQKQNEKLGNIEHNSEETKQGIHALQEQVGALSGQLGNALEMLYSINNFAYNAKNGYTTYADKEVAAVLNEQRRYGGVVVNIEFKIGEESYCEQKDPNASLNIKDVEFMKLLAIALTEEKRHNKNGNIDIVKTFLERVKGMLGTVNCDLGDKDIKEALQEYVETLKKGDNTDDVEYDENLVGKLSKKYKIAIDNAEKDEDGNISLVVSRGDAANINGWTFCDNNDIKSIKFSRGITQIDEDAINNCKALKSVIFPASIREISEGAISSCDALERLIVEPGNRRYRSVNDCIIDCQTSQLVLGCKKSVIPDDGSVLSIRAFAFSGYIGLDIKIPVCIETIQKNTFFNCSGIISCEVTSKPDGWNEMWVSAESELTVKWKEASAQVAEKTRRSSCANEGSKPNANLSADKTPKPTNALSIISCEGTTQETSKPADTKPYIRVNYDNKPDSKGNYILFGEYPQTIKAQSVSIRGSADKDGYYRGSDGERYAKVVANPFDSVYTFSDGSDVTRGNTYYFKVEPIRWRILSESDGSAFILADGIIANHYYHQTNSSTTIDGETVYANNYKHSDIRAWLNGEFLNSAFGEVAQSLIKTTEVDNSVYSTRYSGNEYVCENTFDKVFLLSCREVTNSEYGFSSDDGDRDKARRMTVSDYARSAGVYIGFASYGSWWLRSPNYYYSNCASVVLSDGYAGYYDGVLGDYNDGVVPAMNISLDESDVRKSPEQLSKSLAKDLTKKYGINIIAAEEDESGKYKITISGKTKEIPAEKFKGIEEISHVTIEDGVTSIGEEAFFACKGLASIVLPDSVTNIGDKAFWLCSGLTSVTIPDSVTIIGAHAFEGCDKLSNVVIPASVQAMGSRVFTAGKIICKAKSKPKGWYDDWQDGAEVIWEDASTQVADKKPKSTNNQRTSSRKGTVQGTPKPAANKPYIRVNYDNKPDSKGKYILFGEYPQTIKAQSVSIRGSADKDGYYRGSDGERYAKVVANPYFDSATFSDGSAVTEGETYYFKVEPIRWRILSESDGSAFILADGIIANKAYDAGSDNNYKNSDIRAWLNDEFLNSAFGKAAQGIIKTTEVDNSAYSTGYGYNPNACENTFDKVFLLSYREVTNSEYGFSSNYKKDTARRMTVSDYVRSTGVHMYTIYSYFGCGFWWLRSPNSDYSGYARYVYDDGYADSYDLVFYDYNGVVPALNIIL